MAVKSAENRRDATVKCSMRFKRRDSAFNFTCVRAFSNGNNFYFVFRKGARSRQ